MLERSLAARGEERQLLQSQATRFYLILIHHLHISQNAPYLPPKIWHKLFYYYFSWDGCNTLEK